MMSLRGRGTNRRSTIAAVGLALAAFCSLRGARAGDGAYGRLDGDLAVVGGLGGGVVARDGRALVSSDLRLRYLEVAGAALAYEEAEALGRAGNGQLRRAFLAGVELRPLFPVRFLKAQQTGRAFFDLTLDSLALDVGAVWATREGRAATRPGLYAGLALEAPLAGRARGPWLRLSAQVRWAATALEGDHDPTGRTIVLGLGFAWHEPLRPGLVERGDETVR